MQKVCLLFSGRDLAWQVLKGKERKKNNNNSSSSKVVVVWERWKEKEGCIFKPTLVWSRKG